MEISQNSIIIDNFRVYYRECGEGDALFLIHGMGGSLVFDEVILPLSDCFRVIVVDLPGFGLSDKPDVDYSIDFFISIIDKFIEKLNIKSFHILGLSLGGMIAADYCSRHSNKVKTLFIVSSAGLKAVANRLTNPMIFRLFSFVVRSLIFSNSWALKRFQIGSYHNPGKINPKVFYGYYQFMQYPGARRAWLSAIKNVITVDQFFKNRISSIKNKTIIIWGDDDKTFPFEYAHKFNEIIKDSKLYLIKECGHILTIEKPDEFVSVLKNNRE